LNSQQHQQQEQQEKHFYKIKKCLLPFWLRHVWHQVRKYALVVTWRSCTLSVVSCLAILKIHSCSPSVKISGWTFRLFLFVAKTNICTSGAMHWRVKFLPHVSTSCDNCFCANNLKDNHLYFKLKIQLTMVCVTHSGKCSKCNRVGFE
jgi:hypothetical protein